MKFNINKTDNLFIVKTSGCMIGGDFISMAEEILKHPTWQQNNNVLFDHQDLNFKNATVHDIEKIRKFHKENNLRIGNGKSAIVITSDCLKEWNDLWEEGEKVQTGNIVKLFDNYNEAVNWIKR